MSNLGDMQSLIEVGVALNFRLLFTKRVVTRPRDEFNKRQSIRIQEVRPYSKYLSDRFPGGLGTIEVVDTTQTYRFDWIFRLVERLGTAFGVYAIICLAYTAIYPEEPATLSTWLVIVLPIVLPFLLGWCLVAVELRRERKTVTERVDRYAKPIEGLMREYEVTNQRPDWGHDEAWHEGRRQYILKKMEAE